MRAEEKAAAEAVRAQVDALSAAAREAQAEARNSLKTLKCDPKPCYCGTFPSKFSKGPSEVFVAICIGCLVPPFRWMPSRVWLVHLHSSAKRDLLTKNVFANKRFQWDSV